MITSYQNLFLVVFVMVFEAKTHAKNKFTALFTRWTASSATHI